MLFTQIYIYDNNKNIYMLIYKKSLKKCLRLFNKTLRNYRVSKSFIKKAQTQSEHRDRFNSSPPPVCFHSFIRSLRTPPPSPLHNKPYTKKGSLEEMEGVNDNTSAFMHLNIKQIMAKNLLFKPSQVIYIRKPVFSTSWYIMQIRKPENESTFFRE